MTTKVTVDAHAGWPVLVTAINLDSNGTGVGSTDTWVNANEVRDFYVHSTCMLRIVEKTTGDLPK